MKLHHRLSALIPGMALGLFLLSPWASAQEKAKVQPVKPQPAKPQPVKPQSLKAQSTPKQVVKLTMKDVPLIPRQAFFGNPEKARARLSHDGKQLAYVAPLEGVLNVWV